MKLIEFVKNDGDDNESVRQKYKRFKRERPAAWDEMAKKYPDYSKSDNKDHPEWGNSLAYTRLRTQFRKWLTSDFGAGATAWMLENEIELRNIIMEDLHNS